MKRFRTKKGAKEQAPETEQHAMPSFKGFLGRGKKHEEEAPKKIDLENALPKHDEFRTSLLMTGLSARFSMLREQDDPNTKIGKASDDSVLFPKRQSRLMDFGYGASPLHGLSDIAEVESLKAPGALARLEGGYASGDDAESTKASIMDRGKPTDGNNLFGGRQKIVVGSRTLYENDVAKTSFQKWRKEEKERQLLGHDLDNDDDSTGFESRRRPSEEGAFGLRSESPVLVGYNRKRETSSTVSSSLARNSTAATSIASQPTPSLKDWQSQSTAPTSTSSTPAMERSVTRTRRLYEQSLNQDLQEQQSSALSRIDTLAGRKVFGYRSPDLSNNSASPTTGFGGFGDRRQIMSKGSAPNLRTVSPPTTASSAGMPDLATKINSPSESRLNLIGAPPVSPPISDSGDLGALPIQPEDQGKATAMGVFQRPSQGYDDSRYAERQLQMRQGRETPVQRPRAESNESVRSQSSSSSKRQTRSPKALKVLTAPKEPAYSPFTFLDDSDASPLPAETQFPASAPGVPQVSVQRPSDKDHPAFRNTGLPTPLSMSNVTSNDASPVSEVPELPTVTSPVDSPTLGPATLAPSASGLSGMVRQHMRSESAASSIYGAPQLSSLDNRFPLDARDSTYMEPIISPRGAGWQDGQWNPYQDDAVPEKDEVDSPIPRERRMGSETPSNRSSTALDKDEEDEFANQLADARRRVQQRLTSYAESDSSRSTSPHAAANATRETTSRPNGLGLLRGKSSRGSLAERNREPSQSKAMKMLGIGASTMTSAPSPVRTSFDDAGLPPMKEEESAPAPRAQDYGVEDPYDRTDARSTKSMEKDDDNVHPGLRAFRNARRELQRRKELETLARHQHPAESSAADSSPAPDRETSGGRISRNPSGDRKPPPVYYQQRAPSEESYRSAAGSIPQSRSESRTDRDRSGSDTSNGTRSHSRPPRLRPNPTLMEEGPQSNGSPRPPMLRSPGLPGTNVRRSPIMPPQPYPYGNHGSPAPGRFDRSESAGSLGVHTNRGALEPVSPVQLSPLTPTSMGLPSPSGFMNGSHGGPAAGNRRPSAPVAPGPGLMGQGQGQGFSSTTSTLKDSMKKSIRKKDISDPTFVMSTSRVPTVSLPHSNSSPDIHTDSGSRSRSSSRARSGSNAGAAGYNPPPLPPINPRRKTQADGPRGRGPIGGLLSRGDSDSQLPLSNSNGSSVGESPSSATSSPAMGDDEASDRKWRSRIPQSQNARGANSGSRSPSGYPSMRDARATFVGAGPPVSRSVVTPVMKPHTGAPMGLPGGMI